MDEASREMAAAAEERERELAAREEQLAMLRAKLEAHADGGKAQQGQVSVLVDNLSHSRDELRVKAEQLALVRQSMVVLEQVCTCARTCARAAPPSLLSRVRHPRGAPAGARCEGGGGGSAPRAPGDPRARVRVEGRRDARAHRAATREPDGAQGLCHLRLARPPPCRGSAARAYLSTRWWAAPRSAGAMRSYSARSSRFDARSPMRAPRVSHSARRRWRCRRRPARSRPAGRRARSSNSFTTRRVAPLIASLPARVTTRRLDVTTCRGSACL